MAARRTGRTIGVLGGMGPAATLDFMAKVQARTPHGARDQDHLRLIVDLNPQVPDRNAALSGSGPSPAPVLAAMAQGLERAGAEALVMVCNSAHAFAPEIRAAVPIPLISLIDETVAAVRRDHPDATRVGLLAADACLDARLYQDAFAGAGVQAVTLDAQGRAQFMAVLYRIKAGDTGEGARAQMRTLAAALLDSGAEVIVSACTEVPLVLAAGDIAAPLADSTDALVEATVAFARNGLLSASSASQRTQPLKNVQIIDGADNATFSIFQATADEFALLFPRKGQDLEVPEAVFRRLGRDRAIALFQSLYDRPILKPGAQGIHGTLFYNYYDLRHHLPASKREIDRVESQIPPQVRALYRRARVEAAGGKRGCDKSRGLRPATRPRSSPPRGG